MTLKAAMGKGYVGEVDQAGSSTADDVDNIAWGAIKI